MSGFPAEAQAVQQSFAYFLEGCGGTCGAEIPLFVFCSGAANRLGEFDNAQELIANAVKSGQLQFRAHCRGTRTFAIYQHFSNLGAELIILGHSKIAHNFGPGVKKGRRRTMRRSPKRIEAELAAMQACYSLLF